MIGWGEFARTVPELAAFGAGRLGIPPAYLATLRPNGAPRVHPVSPIITPEGLYLFMEPTSPKGPDLIERGWYAMHNGVPDNSGTGGEFFVSGKGFGVDDPAVRALAVEAAGYQVLDRYVLFELLVAEARCNAYGDVELPSVRRWTA